MCLIEDVSYTVVEAMQTLDQRAWGLTVTNTKRRIIESGN